MRPHPLRVAGRGSHAPAAPSRSLPWGAATSQALAARSHAPCPRPAGRPCEWRSIDGTVLLPLAPGSPKALAQEHALCLTGDGLAHLQATDPQQLLRLIPHVQVFARVAPKQKVGAAGPRGKGQGAALGGRGPRLSPSPAPAGICHHQPEGAGLRDPDVWGRHERRGRPETRRRG